MSNFHIRWGTSSNHMCTGSNLRYELVPAFQALQSTVVSYAWVLWELTFCVSKFASMGESTSNLKAHPGVQTSPLYAHHSTAPKCLLVRMPPPSQSHLYPILPWWVVC
jgi:hypothetical protein